MRSFPAVPLTPVVAALAAGLSIALTSSAALAWSYAEAAKPYAGKTIRVLDEITPLQEVMKKLVPQFTTETGIKVEYELLNHFEVINKGQADMLSGRGYYDAIMLHSVQMGPMLAAGALSPIDGLVADKALANPALDTADLIEPVYGTLSKFGGKSYGYINWNYNQVYWARNDLLTHAGEKAAFKTKYGYELGPAKTMQQVLDIAEFFTRKSGQTLAGQPLKTDFYGIVHEGISGGTSLVSVWENMIRNFGGDLFDAQGAPSFDTPQVVQALTFWAKLWKYAPPGQAEYSLIDVPTVMGNGIAAQSIAWSDFVLGIDKPGASPLAGKFTYGPIPTVPEYKGKRSAAGEPSLLVIPKAAKNKEAVYLFLQWMVDKETQKKLIEAGNGGVPIRNSTYLLPQLTTGTYVPLYQAMKSTHEVAIAKPKSPKIFEIYDALGPIVQQVGLGKLTPEAAAKLGQTKLLEICKKCLL
ncbi:MAG: extracellular solute-binding protein [Burkholderiales bacterium]|nr:extracellular solute-binding protein [Burkholderiales bacterium]